MTGRIHTWQDSFIRVTGLIHTCDVAHSYVWHDSFICVTRYIDTWYVSFISNVTLSYVTWNIHKKKKTASEEANPSPLKGLRLLYLSCDRTHSYMCGMTHIYMCDRTHTYVTWLMYDWHDSFLRDMTVCDMTHSSVKYLIHMWHDSYICDMTHSYVTSWERKQGNYSDLWPGCLSLLRTMPPHFTRGIKSLQGSDLGWRSGWGTHHSYHSGIFLNSPFTLWLNSSPLRSETHTLHLFRRLQQCCWPPTSRRVQPSPQTHLRSVCDRFCDPPWTCLFHSSLHDCGR